MFEMDFWLWPWYALKLEFGSLNFNRIIHTHTHTHHIQSSIRPIFPFEYCRQLVTAVRMVPTSNSNLQKNYNKTYRTTHTKKKWYHGFSYDLSSLILSYIDNGCVVYALYSFSITKRYNGIYFEHYQKQFQVILKNKENEEEHTRVCEPKYML